MNVKASIFSPLFIAGKNANSELSNRTKAGYHQKMVFYLKLKNRWNAAEQIENSVQSRFSIKQLLYCYGGYLS